MDAKQPRPKVLFFDVNETLLDLEPLRQSIKKVLPGEDSAALWFATLLHHTLVMTTCGQYAPMSKVGAAALQMLAAGRGIGLDEAQAQAAVEPIGSLPAHADVRPALERLRGAGIRLAALSNSGADSLAGQLAHAGIADLFEREFSVEMVRKFKPHLEVYRAAVARMNYRSQDCMVVAAHAWDVAGAAWAGLRTAFITRARNRPFPLAPPPELVLADLAALADALA